LILVDKSSTETEVSLVRVQLTWAHAFVHLMV
jgi:hypothetical protein